eukprot:CAMPEP_0197687568 /NCGR_PEP_ID=MMETSP1338-20131121/104163_1 /TAXON_ID=43686 ORGANISM="Pelagodinium beii, Strain RCC1491" /NCGR_SAMPLE_ID=MMETSP1338 /ASSEMBLY_ACC=CAM_ASM_000754 /LENGTH=30 /DNA_ID= /DNA_START= /DNA_END= /DNA_ORIENTATION=
MAKSWRLTCENTNVLENEGCCATVPAAFLK